MYCRFTWQTREDFLRWYLEPSRGAVWGTRSLILSLARRRGLVYIYDWDTRLSVLIYWGSQLAPLVCLSISNNKELESLLLYLNSMTTLSA